MNNRFSDTDKQKSSVHRTVNLSSFMHSKSLRKIAGNEIPGQTDVSEAASPILSEQGGDFS